MHRLVRLLVLLAIATTVLTFKQDALVASEAVVPEEEHSPYHSIHDKEFWINSLIAICTARAT